MRTLLVGLVAGLSVGCASNLSALQTARTMEPGHARVSVGTGVYVPTGQIFGALGQAYDLSTRGADALAKNEPYAWSEADEQAMVTSAVALAVMPPAPQFEAQVRAGLLPNLEAGLRLSTNATRLDAKYRLFHAGDEIDPQKPFAYERSTDVAVSLGVSRHSFSNFLFDALGFVKLDDFSRWDVEAMVLASHEPVRWVGLYGGARYVWSRTTFDSTLERLTYDAMTLTRLPVTLPGAVDMNFVGVTGGLRLGHPQASIFLELTGGYTFAWARVLGKWRDLGGATFYPSAGLMVAF